MIVWIQNPFDNLPAEGYRKQRFSLMAEAFVRAGHRVTLWTSDFNHTTKRTRQLDPRTTLPFSLRLLPTLPYPKNVCLARIRSHRRLARTWEQTAADALPPPDLIVSSIPSVSGAEAALRLGRRFGARVVIDVMDAWPETFERLAPAPLRGLARLALSNLRRRAQRIYREADLVTGVCDRYRDLTGRADFFRAYHGIELAAPVARTSSETLRLLYLGNLGRTYDLGTVLRGLVHLDDTTLDIAGKGPCETQWKNLCHALGLDGRVRFHGYLDDDALRRLLSESDLGLVPMPSDSFVGVPYKFADYAAAGLGIVSSLGGESETLLRENRVGAAYRGGDPTSFANAVRALRGDLSGLAVRARQLTERAFDAVRLYDDYVAGVTRR